MQQADDGSMLTELAERLLGARFGWPGADQVRSRILVGALPPALPVALPAPPRTRLIGSVVTPRAARPGMPPTGEGIEIVLDADAGAYELFAFYERVLGEQGWSVPAAPAGRVGRGGFDPMPAAVPARTFCGGPHGPWLSVQVHGRAGETSDVRIHLDTATPGPCTAAARSLGMPPSLLPTLAPPAGVVMDGLGGGGGDTLWTSNARARTPLPAAELEAHFAGQLKTAGWSRRDGGLHGPLAWSGWAVPDADGWRGLLYVIEEPEPEYRWLHLRAEFGGQSGAFGTSGWSSVVTFASDQP